MIKGNTHKRCHCRHTITGKELGASCPKLRRSDGSWNPSHGAWQFQIELPPAAGGARRPRRRAGYDSQVAAEADLDKVREALAVAGDDADLLRRVGDIIDTAFQKNQALPTPGELRRLFQLDHDVDEIPLIGMFLDRWLAGRKKIKKNTVRAYEVHIRLYLKPVLATIRLDKLRKGHVEAVFAAIEERNERIAIARASRDPKKRLLVKGMRVVGPTTLHRIRATLRAALNSAVRDGYRTDNPARLVELPPPNRTKPLVWTNERVTQWRDTGVVPSPVMVWTPEHTGAFLDHAETAGDTGLYALYHLVAMRGLRRGEACGLHWADVDLDHAVITIRWQITQLGWATNLERPKTDASEDQVSLDTDTVKALRAHRRTQRRERLAAGPGWTETGLVFVTATGEALHPADVTDEFHHLTRQAGLPPIRLHDLRHGAAALALAAGVDMKTISDTLRHSSIVVTADIYGSILPQLAQDAAEKTAAIVPRKHRPRPAA